MEGCVHQIPISTLTVTSLRSANTSEKSSADSSPVTKPAYATIFEQKPQFETIYFSLASINTLRHSHKSLLANNLLQ